MAQGRRIGRGWPTATLGAVLAVGIAACGGGAGHASSVGPRGAASAAGVRDPASSVAADPDYGQSCAMSGLDDTPGCLQVALEAVDRARAREHLGPMRLPADFATRPFDQQMLAVIDAERVDRGLAPVVGVTPGLDQLAVRGAGVDDLAPEPGAGWDAADLEADADYENAVDLDYQWVYDDGPDSDTSGCDRAGDAGCWADRHIILDAFPASGPLLLGAAQDPHGDTQTDDRGGPSMALVLAVARRPSPVTVSWARIRAGLRGAVLVPLRSAPLGVSATGIRDPDHTEPPDPAYTGSCATEGEDDTPGCLAAVLTALDAARAAEGVKPMVLPAGFAGMDTDEQLFVTTNLERVDRGLPPFVGLSAALDANAAVGARTANDPPDPSTAIGDDEEWSGGSVNALDADYGWMYDDGRGSGNIDCPRTGGAGCWGHRNGILDNFGPVGTMVMGAAYDATGDTAAEGWAGGTSMALTLAALPSAPRSWVVTWAQIEAPRV